jgi:hypothetical protein
MVQVQIIQALMVQILMEPAQMEHLQIRQRLIIPRRIILQQTQLLRILPIRIKQPQTTVRTPIRPNQIPPPMGQLQTPRLVVT